MYNEQTGVFTRRVSVNRFKAGQVAGTPHNNGYWSICVDGTKYLAHVLAWLYVYGEWPLQEIDHKDRTKTNNAISNLRQATSGENKQNISGPPAYSKSKILGACWWRGAWQSHIKINGKQTYLGRFKTAEEANEAYMTAKRIAHPFNMI
jgi:hypothetical protein